MSVENQVMVLFAGTQGFADNVPVDSMKKWETDLLRHLSSSHPEIARDIVANKRITDENEKALRAALTGFMATWQ
jgi:F-type H+-transporting ATPase subunit alpha